MANEIEDIYDYLSIKISEWSQDPDLENADASRVAEFCDVYESKNLTPSQKEELMRLIIASLDEELNDGNFGLHWNRIHRLLKDDYKIHQETIEYWSLPEEKDEENVFKVTPYIRTLRQENINSA